VGLARALIRACFPEIATDRVEPLGSGWDNSAFLVDGRIVVRFPRKASAAALMTTEITALGRIARHLPLAVPDPVHQAPGGAGFPWPFAGYALLPGRTACRAALSDDARRALAPTLGTFLRRLHDLDPSGLDLPSDTLGRLRLDARRDELVHRLGVLEREAVIDRSSAWVAAFDALGPDVPPVDADAVVHGDLYARHVLVDDEGAPTGVIDWGDLHRGAPAVDLMVTFALLPSSARAAFLDAYGPVDERDLRLARRRAIFHAAAFTWFGAEAGDVDLATEGRRALEHVLQD
jgi:aminoglycoside phosphotransferase (APT) family kinase protein